MTEEIKAQIDAMDYHSLLRRWRFAPVGDPFFQGETGEYYQKRMDAKREEVGHDEAVRASKQIGWD
jgi:hypothetical protein